jgi:hypothetical protein
MTEELNRALAFGLLKQSTKEQTTLLKSLRREDLKMVGQELNRIHEMTGELADEVWIRYSK